MNCDAHEREGLEGVSHLGVAGARDINHHCTPFLNGVAPGWLESWDVGELIICAQVCAGCRGTWFYVLDEDARRAVCCAQVEPPRLVGPLAGEGDKEALNLGDASEKEKAHLLLGLLQGKAQFVGGVAADRLVVNLNQRLVLLNHALRRGDTGGEGGRGKEKREDGREEGGRGGGRGWWEGGKEGRKEGRKEGERMVGRREGGGEKDEK